MKKEDATNTVIVCLHELLLNEYEQDQLQIPSLDESTRLIGKQAVIESLGLVSLIVDIEQKLFDEYGISVTIADERAMSQGKSPFLTVQTLSEYVEFLVKENSHNE